MNFLIDHIERRYTPPTGICGACFRPKPQAELTGLSGLPTGSNTALCASCVQEAWEAARVQPCANEACSVLVSREYAAEAGPYCAFCLAAGNGRLGVALLAGVGPMGGEGWEDEDA